MRPEGLELLERRLDRLDLDAAELEAHLYGKSRVLLSPGRKAELRRALDTIYSDMAIVVEQIAAAIRGPHAPE